MIEPIIKIKIMSTLMVVPRNVREERCNFRQVLTLRCIQTGSESCKRILDWRSGLDGTSIYTGQLKVYESVILPRGHNQRKERRLRKK
jgi:hypothetical protein